MAKLLLIIFRLVFSYKNQTKLYFLCMAKGSHAQFKLRPLRVELT